MRRGDVIAGAGLVFEVRGTDYPRRNLSRVPAGRSKVVGWVEDHRADAHVGMGRHAARVYNLNVLSNDSFLFRRGRSRLEWK